MTEQLHLGCAGCPEAVIIESRKGPDQSLYSMLTGPANELPPFGLLSGNGHGIQVGGRVALRQCDNRGGGVCPNKREIDNVANAILGDPTVEADLVEYLSVEASRHMLALLEPESRDELGDRSMAHHGGKI